MSWRTLRIIYLLAVVVAGIIIAWGRYIMSESIVREAVKEHREQLYRLIDALMDERDALESMRSRLCAALGLPADSAPEKVAEAVEARRVVVPDDIVAVAHDGLLLIGSSKARQERHNVVGAYFDRLGNLQEIREGSLYDRQLQSLPQLTSAIPADRVLGEGMVAVNRDYLDDLEGAIIETADQLEGGFVLCENCGEQEDTKTLDVMPMILEPMKARIDALRANQGGADHV